MIDGFRAYIQAVSADWAESLDLDWLPSKRGHRAGLDGLTVERIPHRDRRGSERVEVNGSLHRYWHGGDNSGPFPHREVQSAARAVCVALAVDPGLLRISRLEVGVNLCGLRYPALDYLTAVSDLRGAPYVDLAGSIPGKVSQSVKRTGSTVGQTRYRLKGKLYAKPTAAGADALRVELRYAGEYVAPTGIKCFADLINPQPGALDGLREDLVKRLTKDTLWINPLPDTLAEPWGLQTADPSWWHHLKGNDRCRAKTKRRKVEAAAGAPDLAAEVAKGIREAWAQLCPPKLPNCTTPLPGTPTDAVQFGTLDELPNYTTSTRNTNVEASTELDRTQTLQSVGLSTGYLTPAMEARHRDGRCVSCGKVLTSTVRKAMTCSKKCRNAKSNLLHDTAKKVQRRRRKQRATRNALLWDITRPEVLNTIAQRERRPQSTKGMGHSARSAPATASTGAPVTQTSLDLCQSTEHPE